MLSQLSPRILLLMFFAFLISENQYGQQIFQKANPGNQTLDVASQILSSVEYYQVDINQFSHKLNTTRTIEIEIPIGDRIKTIAFEKINILTPAYQLFASSGKPLNTAKRYSFFNGKVVGQQNSKASLIFYDNQFSLSIFDKEGNYEINTYQDLYAGYYNHNRKEKWDQDWACQVIEEIESIGENKGSSITSTPECVTVFIEIDNNMYVKKGSDIANTEAWALNTLSQVAILFIEHNVPINISGSEFQVIPLT